MFSFPNQKKTFSRLLLTALTLLCLSSQITYGVTNLVWNDEFDGATIDTNKWKFDIGNNSSISGGGWGNGEREYYTSRTNNAFVTNGILHIVAQKESFGGLPYTSARLKTEGLFVRPYGRFEFRAKLPHGTGFWPALWLLATNYPSLPAHWPACGEIDVMENKGSSFTQVLGTLHKDTAANPNVNNPTSTTFTFTGGDSVTNFHTYVLSWTSNSIRWSIDGNAPFKTVTSFATTSQGPYPAPFNRPFYIIMNLAVGGAFLGSPTDSNINANTTFPGEVQIDYVRVYDDFPFSPAVLSVTPNNGCASEGTAVTIAGSNFVNGATVTIGGIAASNIVFVNTNAMTATTPAGSAGAKNVVVTNPDSSSGTLTNGFTHNGPPLSAGLVSAIPAIEGATLTWSAAAGGTPPITYELWEGPDTSFGSETYLLTTNSLSTFVPLYPGSNSPLSYFFWAGAVDTCGNYDTNLVYLTVQPLLDPNGDQDADGMLNGFEQQYGLSPFDSADAALDPDGDTLSNLQESVLGTDPTNVSSPFRVTGIALAGDDIVVSWDSAPGLTNVVEATFDFGATYSNISPNIVITGSGVVSTNYLDPGAATNTPLEFYRIRLLP